MIHVLVFSISRASTYNDCFHSHFHSKQAPRWYNSGCYLAGFVLSVRCLAQISTKSPVAVRHIHTKPAAVCRERRICSRSNIFVVAGRREFRFPKSLTRLPTRSQYVSFRLKQVVAMYTDPTADKLRFVPFNTQARPSSSPTPSA